MTLKSIFYFPSVAANPFIVDLITLPVPCYLVQTPIRFYLFIAITHHPTPCHYVAVRTNYPARTQKIVCHIPQNTAMCPTPRVSISDVFISAGHDQPASHLQQPPSGSFQVDDFPIPFILDYLGHPSIVHAFFHDAGLQGG